MMKIKCWNIYSRPKMESLMLNLTSANQILTKFLCSSLPEKERLDQSISVCQLSTSYLTGSKISLCSFHFPLLQGSNSALTDQQMPSITFKFLITLSCKTLLPCTALQSSLLFVRLDVAQVINHWIEGHLISKLWKVFF